jgi:hypothetical protein
MSNKKTIFVTVLGGVAEVDWDTVPKDLNVEIVDIDSLKVDKHHLRKLSPAARVYAKAKGYT